MTADASPWHVSLTRLPVASAIVIGTSLAILASPNAIFTLCYSLVDITGSSIFSGGLLLLSLLSAFYVSFRRDVEFSVTDALFALFLLCVIASLLLNGRTTDNKEWLIFGVTLAAYPAFRFVSYPKLVDARPAFCAITAAIVVLGTIITSQELYAQWNTAHGKPIVFGFHTAITHFAGAIAVLMIAASTAPLTKRGAILISAFIIFPVVVFAASQVRATFIAMLGAMCIAVVIGIGKQRKYAAFLCLTVVIGICIGLSVRASTSLLFLSYAVSDIESGSGKKIYIGPTVQPGGELAASSGEPAASSAKPTSSAFSPLEADIRKGVPSCNINVNMYNSIAERRALMLDSIYLIPRAGLFGLGLDGFLKYACMQGLQAHNSFFQTFVEFGWIGGVALIALVVVSLLRLLPNVWRSEPSRFLICFLAYSVAISLTHGRTSREFLLFALLGLASGIRDGGKKAISA